MIYINKSPTIQKENVADESPSISHENRSLNIILIN